MKQSGKLISQIAKELGLTESALRNWVKQAQVDQTKAPNGPLTTEERSCASQTASRCQTLSDGARFLKKGRSLFCCREFSSYELIQAEKANFPIALMCDALEVSRSGYYAWSGRPPAARSQQNQQLKEQIGQIHQKSRNSYGAPRIHAALKHKGFEVGRHRVARLMKQQGICVRPRRRFKTTTDSNHPFPVAENILNRNFTTQQPDSAWVADITYIPTTQGWLYLAVVIDLFSRRVVGWSMAEHMRAELVLGALQAALGHRIPAPSGLLFHSDRGSQYASGDYREALQTAGIDCSMSRKTNTTVGGFPAVGECEEGNCWDNAVAESCFGTVKTELISSRELITKEDAKSTIVEWIEVFYNRERLHSTLNYLSPVQFQEQYWSSLRQSAAA